MIPDAKSSEPMGSGSQRPHPEDLGVDVVRGFPDIQGLPGEPDQAPSPGVGLPHLQGLEWNPPLLVLLGRDGEVLHHAPRAEKTYGKAVPTARPRPAS